MWLYVEKPKDDFTGSRRLFAFSHYLLHTAHPS